MPNITKFYRVDFESVYHCFFRRHVCLSNLKHALPLTTCKTVFSHLNSLSLVRLMKSSTFGLGLFFSLLRTIYFTQNVLYIADVCKPGWSYFNGICYSTSHSCKNWTEAEKTCQAYSGNLITVRNQEENVYIQHRLNGARGWIGLNDRVIEGTFDWADNQTSNFSYWAKNQPNNFNNEDCVHTLGVRHSFMWNDVNCGTCHNYTCSEGLWLTYLFYIPTGVTITGSTNVCGNNYPIICEKKILGKNDLIKVS